MDKLTKFNRAVARATPEVRDMNAGAFRRASVKFSFTHEGEKHVYEIVVEKSHRLMASFGYEKDAVELWRWTGTYTATKEDMPEDVVGLDRLRDLAAMSDDEARIVFMEYRDGAARFAHEMGLTAPQGYRPAA